MPKSSVYINTISFTFERMNSVDEIIEIYSISMLLFKSIFNPPWLQVVPLSEICKLL